MVDVMLVHGAYHGAWCWDLLRRELERRGHRTVAVNLPIDDPTAGAARYAATVVDAMADLERPVVVGHSMGGLVIPLVAAAREVERLIFLHGLLPLPGASLSDQRKAEPIDAPHALQAKEWIDAGDGTWRVGPATARELFFHDVPDELATWAIERLRPQAYRFIDETTPMTAWPDTDRAYLVARADRAVNPSWSRDAARERLGVEAVEIDGGHSSFLARPRELADRLASLLA
jgi:pimeloyl-ACP methyl ester carboxylesterase